MTLALPLAGIMALWLGVMRLAEKSGLVNVFAGALRPIMRWLFPDVPAKHPAMGSMVMNMAANMLGLANAATPLGLRAMQHLETLNPRPGVATNAMCTFLAINTSSIQLIPATTVAILSAAGANPRPPSSERLSWRPSARRQPESQPLKPWKSCPILRFRNWERSQEAPAPNETSIEQEVPTPLSPAWQILLCCCWRFFFGALFVTMAFFRQLRDACELRARFLSVSDSVRFS